MQEVAQSFASFVRMRTGTLLRTAFLLTGNAGAAEELVQDTLVHLYPRWDRVSAADVPLAYVRRSMTNRFLNSRHRAEREVVVAHVPDRGLLDVAAARAADRDEMWALLFTLVARQRAALVLRYYDDLSDEEIARALHCRVGTVRSLISRGLAHLRQQAGRDPDARPRSQR